MSNVLVPDNIVTRPYQSDHLTISPWLDEQIWGHRIWHSQSPWLIFLEFLTVAEYCLRENCLFDENGSHYPLMFKPYKRLHLRNILFNNDSISRIDEKKGDSRKSWKEWLTKMEETAKGVSIRDFSYLKNRFSSFHDFATLVAIIRNSAVESDTNKRWTSRFIFPFGPQSLYEDLDIKFGEAKRDRVNFGRTGELLYLMLCRSKTSKNLIEPLTTLLDGKNPLNDLMKLLQPGEDNNISERGKSYLPYIQHPSFDVLGEDWENVLNLRLPGFDVYQHLVLLGAFHIFLYQLNTAVQLYPAASKLYFICEAIAPKKTLVRELSAINYQENNVLTSQALHEYISKVEQSDDWQSAIKDSAIEADAFTQCLEILRKKFWWGDDYNGSSSPTDLIKDFVEGALKRHRQNPGNIHRVYGRSFGLVSKRGTNRLRYAPNDSFLKTILITNVPSRIEFSEFLEKLYKRYGLIFGEREAALAIPSENFDKKAFQANTERLEHRLSSMGMLRRLSDGCAYVINPFVSEVE